MPGTTLTGAAFDLAFHPLDHEAVLRLREGAAWRHLPAPSADRYRPLCDIPALDAFLATAAARSPPVTLADSRRTGSASVPPEAFTRRDGLIDPAAVFRLFDRGATLVVSQFQDHHPPLAHFCRGLERAFLHAVQANAYLTPAGAQGFRTHFDTHDVLVLQVRGEKRWRLFPGQPLPSPSRRTPWDGTNHPPDGEPAEITLRAGDALYVPRGVLHDAATQPAGDPSLHLTIGFLGPVWADLLHEAVDLLELEDASLRGGIPTWRLSEPDALPQLLRDAAGRAARLATATLLERGLALLLDRLAADRLTLSGRGLLAPPPGPRDRLRLSDTMLHHVAIGPDGGATLRWGAGAEPLSAREIAWLEALEEGATAETLGEDALAFCQRLHAAGLLIHEAAPGGSA